MENSREFIRDNLELFPKCMLTYEDRVKKRKILGICFAGYEKKAQDEFSVLNELIERTNKKIKTDKLFDWNTEICFFEDGSIEFLLYLEWDRKEKDYVIVLTQEEKGALIDKAEVLLETYRDMDGKSMRKVFGSHCYAIKACREKFVTEMMEKNLKQ